MDDIVFALKNMLQVSTVSVKTCFFHKISLLQIRRGKRNDLGIHFHISPLKRML